MRCPHCEKEFTYTWKRYFKGVFGYQECTFCEKGLRIKHGVKYFVTLILLESIIVIVTIALLLELLEMTIILVIVIQVVISGIILFPIDRYLDDNWGKFIPAKKKKGKNE